MGHRRGGGTLVVGQRLLDLLFGSDDADEVAALGMGAEHKVRLFGGRPLQMRRRGSGPLLSQGLLFLFLFQLDGFQGSNPEGQELIIVLVLVLCGSLAADCRNSGGLGGVETRL